MIPNKSELLNIEQADFSYWGNEETAIIQLITNAHWAHLNYVFVDKNTFSQELIDKVKAAGFSVVTGYGDVARIKISW